LRVLHTHTASVTRHGLGLDEALAVTANRNETYDDPRARPGYSRRNPLESPVFSRYGQLAAKKRPVEPTLTGQGLTAKKSSVRPTRSGYGALASPSRGGQPKARTKLLGVEETNRSRSRGRRRWIAFHGPTHTPCDAPSPPLRHAHFRQRRPEGSRRHRGQLRMTPLCAVFAAKLQKAG